MKVVMRMVRGEVMMLLMTGMNDEWDTAPWTDDDDEFYSAPLHRAALRAPW